MKIPIPEDILMLVDSPLIYTGLMYWRRGEMSWEQALMWCILEQNKEIKTLIGERMLQIEKSSSPSIIKFEDI